MYIQLKPSRQWALKKELKTNLFGPCKERTRKRRRSQQRLMVNKSSYQKSNLFIFSNLIHYWSYRAGRNLKINYNLRIFNLSPKTSTSQPFIIIFIFINRPGYSNLTWAPINIINITYLRRHCIYSRNKQFWI